MTAKDSPTRKLAAIMFTDMVGYTSLMQEDEDKARNLIQRHRAHMKPFVEKHGGEIIQFVGDGTFCRFESAIEAVNAALEIQKILESEPEINLRIGVHVGDVVVEGDEVYGDGVNIAVRLEPLAEPGGVCISGRVYDDIKNQSDIETAYLGKKSLKNVDRPLKIYCLAGEGLKVSKTFEEEQKTVVESDELEPDVPALQSSLKRLLPWAAGAAVVLILFFGKGWFFGESSITEVIADENSLAVMFIENIMDPSDSERHAEIIRELLITDLSQSHDLRIIGGQRLYDIAKRNRKDQERIIDRTNASEVAREADARWMLVGKLSRIGSQIVLTTQIEGVRDGKIVDSQRADSDNLFALVDMLTEEVKADLGLVSRPGEIDAPVQEMTTGSSIAYQRYFEGIEYLNDSKFEEAIERFQSALEIDSTFTQALYKLAMAEWWHYSLSGSDGDEARQTIERIMIHRNKLSEEMQLLVDGLLANVDRDYTAAQVIYKSLLKKYPDEKEVYFGLGEAYYHEALAHGSGTRLKALDAFERALELDPEFMLAYRHIFDIYAEEKLFDRGIQKGSELVASHPNMSRGYIHLARMYRHIGDFNLAIETYKKAIEINPKDYETIQLLGLTYNFMGKYDKAIEVYNDLFRSDVS